jgi:hypothetical protein
MEKFAGGEGRVEAISNAGNGRGGCLCKGALRELIYHNRQLCCIIVLLDGGEDET